MSKEGFLFFTHNDKELRGRRKGNPRVKKPISAQCFSPQVPEMLHNDAGDHGFSHCGFFLLQNAGILLGFCIMLLIAIFEHKIQLDLGY